MSDGKAFFDTNVLIYAYSDDDIEKQMKSLKAFNKYERFVSTQVLTEFCNIALKKLHLPVTEINTKLSFITNKCNIIIVDEADLSRALFIHEKYKYSYYDSLVIQSALEAGCDFLLTEDMNDGQIIENSLKINNIFKC